MSELQRVKKVIDWLVFEGVAESQKDVAEKCGYGESYMSQVLSGRVNLSSRFIKNLAMLDERLSEEWITTGDGDMLRNNQTNNQSGTGNNNQQGYAGHDLMLTSNSEKLLEDFVKGVQGQNKVAEKAMEQTGKALEQTGKALDSIKIALNEAAENRRLVERLISIIEKNNKE